MSEGHTMFVFRVTNADHKAFKELADAHRLDISELLRAFLKHTLEYARAHRQTLPPVIAKRFRPIPQ